MSDKFAPLTDSQLSGLAAPSPSAANPDDRPPTWNQRVYLLWLTLLNLQSIIGRRTRETISTDIEQQYNNFMRNGMRYRPIGENVRALECVAIFNNILTRHEGDN